MKLIFAFAFVAWSMSWMSCSDLKRSAIARDTVAFSTEDANELRCYAVISERKLVVIYPGSANSAGGWTLTDAEGNRVQPITVEERSAETIVTFEPVNNRYLFHQTGIRGDVDSVYRLAYDERSNDVAFRAVPEQYHPSLKRFGIAATLQPYAVSKLIDNESEAIQRENEILIAGCWMKIYTRYQRDTLFATIRMVNQSPETILIDPAKIHLSDRGWVVFAVPEPDHTITEVLKGGRTSVDLKFPVIKKPGYQIDLKGIHFMSGEPVLQPVVALTAMWVEAGE